MTDLERAQWANDAALMQEFKDSPAYAVLRWHMERAKAYSLAIVLSANDVNELLTQRGAVVAIDRLMNLPDNIIDEERRLREQAQ